MRAVRLERRACDLSQGIVALRRRGTDGLVFAVIVSREEAGQGNGK